MSFDQPYGSWGNGAAMRIAPVGLLANSEAEVLGWSDTVTAIMDLFAPRHESCDEPSLQRSQSWASPGEICLELNNFFNSLCLRHSGLKGTSKKTRPLF